MNDSPVLDAPRTDDNCPLRTFIAELDPIAPYVDEMDSWITIPIRVVHSGTSGRVELELGPYTLDPNDIDRLREAIRAYDTCVHGPTIRRIQ